MNDRYLVMTRLRSSMNDRYLVMTRLRRAYAGYQISRPLPEMQKSPSRLSC
ncbi:hypothetical protein [Streptococcus pseudopneumoniae]|uniref:hypothetical protein n=1 Tax=Streptococcus pseudopneumoniae TaxID=257758 RepID=UPI0012BD2CD5|nr:hypothetical protein [Streptococcus pseudopneumoniae]